MTTPDQTKYIGNYKNDHLDGKIMIQYDGILDILPFR